jgi:hypothetical protein
MGDLTRYTPNSDPDGERILLRLITAIERAARTGWPETARLIALLAVAAAAVALVILASR